MGEVGKVGVPVPHLGDMRSLFAGIPLDAMNTSMTINATAAWLLALYAALAEEQGADKTKLTGTVQNDILKEYLSRRDLHLPARAVAAADQGRDRLHRARDAEMKWTNVCSYHLQETATAPARGELKSRRLCPWQKRNSRTTLLEALLHIGRISFSVVRQVVPSLAHRLFAGLKRSREWH